MINISALGQPDYKKTIVTKKGYNNDIITALNAKFPAAVEQTKNVKFSGDTLLLKGRAIFNYIKNNIRYRRDDPGKQVIQMPSRMIMDTRSGDCKSMALSAAAFMYNNGFKNVRLRYVSYDAGDITPTHVYAVGSDTSGNDIIIDAVYKQFNKELPYRYKIDYKMEISVLSGITVRRGANKPVPADQQAQTIDPAQANMMMDKRLKSLYDKLPPSGVLSNVVANAIARRAGMTNFPKYNDEQLRKYAMRLEQHMNNKSRLIRMLVSREIKLIKNGSFVGNVVTVYSPGIQGIVNEIGFLKKFRNKIKEAAKKVTPKAILKGVKTVGLVPVRKAFLAMVALNVRGLAKRMSVAPESELKKMWVDKFGGEWKVLRQAINNGKKRKALFGASKKVRAIKGVGYMVVENDINGAAIGMTGVEIAGLIAAASPVLVAVANIFKKNGVPEIPENAAAPQEGGDFPEAPAADQDQKQGFADYVEKAVDIAKATGIIPDRPLTPQQQRVEANLPEGDDFTAEAATGGAKTSFGINPLLLVGVAAGAYLLTRKK